ncbi:hypothetical protein ABK040_015651 [Willaertia magna]
MKCPCKTNKRVGKRKRISKNNKRSEYKRSFNSNFPFDIAKVVAELIIRKVELSLKKSCLDLSDDDSRYIQEHVINERNFVESVKNDSSPVQIYFFEKNDKIDKELIGVVFKLQNQEGFACTYFKSIR